MHKAKVRKVRTSLTDLPYDCVGELCGFLLLSTQYAISRTCHHLRTGVLHRSLYSKILNIREVSSQESPSDGLEPFLCVLYKVLKCDGFEVPLEESHGCMIHCQKNWSYRWGLLTDDVPVQEGYHEHIVLEQCCLALRRMTTQTQEEGGRDAVYAIVQQNFPRLLMLLLRHPNLRVVYQAILALSNIVTIDPGIFHKMNAPDNSVCIYENQVSGWREFPTLDHHYAWTPVTLLRRLLSPLCHRAPPRAYCSEDCGGFGTHHCYYLHCARPRGLPRINRKSLSTGMRRIRKDDSQSTLSLGEDNPGCCFQRVGTAAKVG